MSDDESAIRNPQSEMPESERQRYEIYQCIKEVFGSATGRIVLDWLKRRFHFGRCFVVPGDSHMTLFHYGMQNPVNEIVRILETPIEELMQSPSPTWREFMEPANLSPATLDDWAAQLGQNRSFEI